MVTVGDSKENNDVTDETLRVRILILLETYFVAIFLVLFKIK